VHQLVIKVLNIVDARCDHEVFLLFQMPTIYIKLLFSRTRATQETDPAILTLPEAQLLCPGSNCHINRHTPRLQGLMGRSISPASHRRPRPQGTLLQQRRQRVSKHTFLFGVCETSHCTRNIPW